MIQRCPECEKWCSTHGENFIERGVKGLGRQINDWGEIGETLAGKFGKRICQFFGAYTSPTRAVYDALFENKYQFACEHCGHCWGTDNEEDDETAYYEHECNVTELCEKFSDVNKTDGDEWREYLNELQEAWDSEFNTAITQSMICDATAALYVCGSMDLDDNEELLELALTEINKSLKLFDDENSHITKGVILALLNNNKSPKSYDALKELIYLKEKETHPYFALDGIHLIYDKELKWYEERFLEIPKEQRKYLVLVDDYVTIPDSFKVLRLSGVPSNLKFLGDNILENTLYVVHPLKDDTYIPYNEYSIELFRDKVEEYRHIMECLGAKSFVIKDIVNEGVESSQKNKLDVTAGVKYKDIGVKGAYEKNDNSEQYHKLYDELSKEIVCELTKLPYIPNDVLWYNRTPAWQRDCESRMNGRLLMLKQRVSNTLNSGLTKSNSQKIKAEFDSMLVKLEGEFEKDDFFSVIEERSHTWEITVEFYPMSRYGKGFFAKFLRLFMKK